jgi:hypothetical protein
LTLPGAAVAQDKLKPGKEIDLGKCGNVTLHLSEDRKRLLIGFDVDPRGFDKTGVNTFIDALKKVREKMER